MIENGKKVKFHYTLEVNGKVIESSISGDPFEYVHGKDNIIEGLQKNLEGRNEGDKCTIEVPPSEAYGDKNPQAILEVEKEKVPEEGLKLGTTLQAKGSDGNMMKGTVQDIRPETVLIDFNHPLAGKVLKFDVEILSVSG